MAPSLPSLPHLVTWIHLLPLAASSCLTTDSRGVEWRGEVGEVATSPCSYIDPLLEGEGRWLCGEEGEFTTGQPDRRGCTSSRLVGEADPGVVASYITGLSRQLTGGEVVQVVELLGDLTWVEVVDLVLGLPLAWLELLHSDEGDQPMLGNTELFAEVMHLLEEQAEDAVEGFTYNGTNLVVGRGAAREGRVVFPSATGSRVELSTGESMAYSGLLVRGPVLHDIYRRNVLGSLDLATELLHLSTQSTVGDLVLHLDFLEGREAAGANPSCAFLNQVSTCTFTCTSTCTSTCTCTFTCTCTCTSTFTCTCTCTCTCTTNTR